VTKLYLKFQSNLKIVPPAVPERMGMGKGASPMGHRKSVAAPQMMVSEEDDEAEFFDAECLKLMNEFFYGVRIFPGQDPGHVYVGWVTTQYHFHSTAFSQAKVRRVTISGIDEFDSEVEKYVQVL